jgi:hypothetical protein
MTPSIRHPGTAYSHRNDDAGSTADARRQRLEPRLELRHQVLRPRRGADRQLRAGMGPSSAPPRAAAAGPPPRRRRRGRCCCRAAADRPGSRSRRPVRRRAAPPGSCRPPRCAAPSSGSGPRRGRSARRRGPRRRSRGRRGRGSSGCGSASRPPASSTRANVTCAPTSAWRSKFRRRDAPACPAPSRRPAMRLCRPAWNAGSKPKSRPVASPSATVKASTAGFSVRRSRWRRSAGRSRRR